MNKINLINSEKAEVGKITNKNIESSVTDFSKEKIVNIFIGPPSKPEMDFKAMEFFFSQKGAHIICGGTTAEIASRFLDKPIVTSLEYDDNDIPPTAKIDTVELVTEGVITLNQAVKNIRNLKSESCLRQDKDWEDKKLIDKKLIDKKDGSSILCKILMNAAEINICFGKGINPNHQKDDFPYNFSVKSNLILTLVSELKAVGKKVTLNCF